MSITIKRVAIYARVSTADQTTENQLSELRRYVEARGWTATEYVDNGVYGSKDRRPALDLLSVAIRLHQVDAVVCWRLDRLGRNLRHLVLFLDDLHARGIAFVTLGEGLDTSTAAGRLVAGVLGSIAEFERARIQEGVHAGLRRARAQGKRLGRRPSTAVRNLDTCIGLSHVAAATKLGVSVASVKRWRRAHRSFGPFWCEVTRTLATTVTVEMPGGRCICRQRYSSCLSRNGPTGAFTPSAKSRRNMASAYTPALSVLRSRPH
jgi:DNA invertase Pin-like site-specific DNA recombinase